MLSVYLPIALKVIANCGTRERHFDKYIHNRPTYLPFSLLSFSSCFKIKVLVLHGSGDIYPLQRRCCRRRALFYSAYHR